MWNSNLTVPKSAILAIRRTHCDTVRQQVHLGYRLISKEYRIHNLSVVANLRWPRGGGVSEAHFDLWNLYSDLKIKVSRAIPSRRQRERGRRRDGRRTNHRRKGRESRPGKQRALVTVFTFYWFFKKCFVTENNIRDYNGSHSLSTSCSHLEPTWLCLDYLLEHNDFDTVFDKFVNYRLIGLQTRAQ